MKPRFFATPSSFRAWLKVNHRTTAELLVGFCKRSSERPSITWPEAVDERYTIRFTPRRAQSTWSAVNLAKVAQLKARGLMQPAGVAAYEARSEKRSRTYSYERTKEPALDAKLEKSFQADRRAVAFFEAQAPSYRRRVIHWVVTAKSEEVRLRRLGRLIEAFAAGRRA